MLGVLKERGYRSEQLIKQLPGGSQIDVSNLVVICPPDPLVRQESDADINFATAQSRDHCSDPQLGSLSSSDWWQISRPCRE